MNRGGVNKWSGGKEMSSFGDYNSGYGNQWNSSNPSWDGMGSSNLNSNNNSGNNNNNNNNISPVSYSGGVSSNVSGGFKRQWQTANPGEEKKGSKMMKMNQSYGSGNNQDQYGNVDGMYSNQSGQFSSNWNDTKKKGGGTSWGTPSQYNSGNNWQGKSPQKTMKNFGYQGGFQNDYSWDYSAETYVDETDYGDFGSGYYNNQGGFEDYYTDQTYGGFDQKQRGAKFGGRGQRGGGVTARGARTGQQSSWGQWATDDNTTFGFGNGGFTSGGAFGSPRGRRGTGRGGGNVGSEINRIREAIRTVQGYSDIDLSFLLKGSESFEQGNQFKSNRSPRGVGYDGNGKFFFFFFFFHTL